jgi:16S rRNA (cytosine967-C5)-methyltransferase
MAATRGATATRRAALEVLRAVRAGTLADHAMERAAEGLNRRDRAWVHELAYGTLRLRGRIDHILDAVVRGGIAPVEPDVVDILRLGVYQFREMGSVPTYAAISQSVDLTRAASVGRASGFVNGVLQSITRRQNDRTFPTLADDPVAHLVTWGSHPGWLVERWISRWGGDGAAAIVEANNRRPEIYLRPVGIRAGEAVERLGAAGMAATLVDFAPDSVLLGDGTGAREALAVVPAVVQDPAAALVARYAGAPEGALVLDLCAAPGGKAVAMSERARAVVANDLSLRRQRRVTENIARLGLTDRVYPVVADARQPPFRPADVVLLDSPCTGTGTFRRHPDARWRVQPSDLDNLMLLQRELLAAAGPLVAPGGILVYSTCSIEREENEDQVLRFLEDNRDFAIEPPEGLGVPNLVNDQGFLSVLPHRQGVDGAFAARLRRAV